MNKNVIFSVIIFLFTTAVNASFQPLIIGLGGGVGSGKSTMAYTLKTTFHEYVEVISMDDFPMYKWSELTPEQQKTHDFDDPNTINYQKMANTIDSLFVGTKVQCPDYSFCNPTRPAGTFWKPKPILILEGFHLFYNQIIRNYFLANPFNLACFINVSDERDRLNRIITRNLKDRNESEEDSRRRYLSHIKPSYEKHIKPTERFAHLTFNNNDKESFNIAISILSDRIEKFLKIHNIGNFLLQKAL